MVRVPIVDLNQAQLGMLRHCELEAMTLIVLDQPSHQRSGAWSSLTYEVP